MHTVESVTETFGEIVATTEAAVVRVRNNRVTVHRRNHAGDEMLPRGYVIGGNMLYLPETPDD